MALLKIPIDAKAVFKKRPNRFLAIVDIYYPGKMKNVEVHVHDPGRLTELLYEDNTVFLKKAQNPRRKTKWDLISARGENNNVLIHSGYHQKLVLNFLQTNGTLLFNNIKKIKTEPAYHKSRLDFLIENEDEEIWIETKGCTLKKGKFALFPDAPTKRGTKHVKHLIELNEQGKRAVIIFLVFVDTEYFMPNRAIDPIFTKTLKRAHKKGVEIFPLLFSYENERIFYKKIIPLKFNN